MVEKEAQMTQLELSPVDDATKSLLEAGWPQELVDSSKVVKAEDSVKNKFLNAGWPEELVNEHLKSAAKKLNSFEKLPECKFIRISSISKSFNGRSILQNVNLEIKPGEVFGIIGLSGTGKTTLLNLIIGFIEPDQGDIIIKLSNGSVVSAAQNPQLVKTLFGFSTQDPSFYSKLTVKENLQHFGSLYGINAAKLDAKADDLLNLVGLKDSKDVIAQNLSGGMQKRLDIACAMVHEPKILILDEPTADLDPLLRKQMWGLIRKINQRGTTIIVASHFVGEIEAACDKVAVLSNKTVSRVGTVDELIDVYSKNYALEIETKSKNYDSLVKKISRLKSVLSETHDEQSVIINTKNPKHTLAWLSNYMEQNKDEVVKMNLSRPSLAQVFESIVRK